MKVINKYSEWTVIDQKRSKVNQIHVWRNCVENICRYESAMNNVCNFFLAVYAVYDWAQLTWLIKISSGPVIFIKEYRESQFNNNKTISKYDYGPVKRRVSNLFKFEKVFTETE